MAHRPRKKVISVGRVTGRSTRTLVRLRTVIAVPAVLAKDSGEGEPVALVLAAAVLMPAVLAAEREASRSRAACGGRAGARRLSRGRMGRS